MSEFKELTETKKTFSISVNEAWKEKIDYLKKSFGGNKFFRAWFLSNLDKAYYQARKGLKYDFEGLLTSKELNQLGTHRRNRDKSVKYYDNLIKFLNATPNGKWFKAKQVAQMFDVYKGENTTKTYGIILRHLVFFKYGVREGNASNKRWRYKNDREDMIIGLNAFKNHKDMSALPASMGKMHAIKEGEIDEMEFYNLKDLIDQAERTKSDELGKTDVTSNMYYLCDPDLDIDPNFRTLYEGWK